MLRVYLGDTSLIHFNLTQICCIKLIIYLYIIIFYIIFIYIIYLIMVSL